jgi:hypothetical protein
MTVELPENVPTSRTFTAPRWPTSSSRSQSGVNTIRLWGSQPSQATLALSYVNISDADAARFIRRYNSAKGPITEVTLPSAGLHRVEQPAPHPVRHRRRHPGPALVLPRERPTAHHQRQTGNLLSPIESGGRA